MRSWREWSVCSLSHIKQHRNPMLALVLSGWEKIDWVVVVALLTVA